MTVDSAAVVRARAPKGAGSIDGFVVQIMRRVISSGWTVVFKVFVPLMLVAISIFLLLTLFAFPGQPPSEAVVGILIAVGATVFFCWYGARLKRISINQHNFYVRNLRKEITIPLADIYAVARDV